MRIDAHQHFWRYDAAAYGWIDERMDALRRDFLPEDLDPHRRRCGVDATVAVQARAAEADTRFLLDLARRTEWVVGVVGWIDFLAADLDERLEGCAAEPLLVGFRHPVQDEPDDGFLLREDFLAGVGRLGDRWAYDILIYPRQLPAAVAFVRRLPGHRLVLDHMAKPAIRTGERQEWARSLREIAAAPNVACKVSGLVTEADWSGWRADELRPYLDVALDAFGPERLLFGSDWPVCTLAASYEEVLGVVEDWLAPLAPSERAAILGGNAARVYRLPLRSRG